MTLHSQNDFSIPEETVRIARAAYPKGNPYLKLRDALGTIYQDQAFAHLFPDNGRPAQAPWRLALITVLQFLEELPDRQAADAVRGRIDWKYLLGLPLDTLQRTRVAQRTGATTNRLHAYSGQSASYQPPHVRRGSDAFRPQQSRGRGW